jgi:hypothetical protein
VKHAAPSRPCGLLGTLGVDVVPVKLSPAGVEINLVDAEPSLPLPDVSADPEETDNEEGEVTVEEFVGGSDLLAKGRDGDVELRKSV